MKVAVYGYGAMGKWVCTLVKEASDLELVGAVSSTATAADCSLYSDLESLPVVDVIIDFSHPDRLDVLMDYATNKGVALVVCTTGYTDAQEAKLIAASQQIPIVLASNTSQGVNLMHLLVEQAVRVLKDSFDIELVEAHHHRKLDAPSGTAKSLLETIQTNLETPADLVYGRSGMTKRAPQEIGVHSLRGGSIVGEHTVVFAGDEELLEIKHTALSKKIFAKGAVRAAQFVVAQKVGLFGMKDVIRV